MTLFPNKSIPYHSALDNRRFEQFVRNLYYQDIQQRLYGNKFDDVVLLSGNKEQGRDCVLLKNKKNVGVIQCKLYSNKLCKSESTKEIIKFCLYAILNSDFIDDKHTFEYHFVAPTSFKNDTILYLENFSQEVFEEKELTNWIEQVIKENKSLSAINLDNDRDALHEILSCITIVPVINVELDRRIHLEHNRNLLDEFFDVMKVVDTSSLEPIKQALEDLKSGRISYNDGLIKELQTASFTLYMCKNYFGNLKDSHVHRKETTDIINWIKSPLPIDQKKEPENILFLSGAAGCGKTTILKDLYESLNAENILVLGLKSDALIAKNLEELRLKINFSYSITKSLFEISQRHDKVVLLIDQIDALSQYLSANRDYINTYIQLIESLKKYSNIRIVVSVREYDLNYDLALQHYRENKKIEVGNLQEKDVEIVLNKLGLSKRQLSDALFSLLLNPNNLDVFCRIYNEDTNIDEIRTLQHLYISLWKQLSADKNIDKENLKTLLYAIVEKQNKEHAISILLDTIIEDYTIEFNFLRSKGIIIEGKDKLISLFHQTFFDYVFARKFIEERKDIVQYLKENNQSIAIRSTLKMIYSYISVLDRKKYIYITKYLLSSHEIRPHIKSLIISLLATIESPKDDEKKIVQIFVIPKTYYLNIFIDSLKSAGWTSWCIKTGLLKTLYTIEPDRLDTFFARKSRFSVFIQNHYLFRNYLPFEKKKNLNRNLASYLLRQNLKTNSKEIFDFLNSLEFSDKKSVIGNLLYFNRDWNHTIVYDLFDYCKDAMDSFSYYHALENIALENVDFVFNELRNDIYKTIIERNTRDDDWYQKKKLLEKLHKSAPEKSIEFLYEVVLAAIKSHEYLWTSDEDKLLVPDGLFESFDIRSDRDYYSGEERIYGRLVRWLKEIQKTNYSFYENFLKVNYNSKYKSILRIVIIVLDTPRKENEDIIVSIINWLYSIGKIKHNGRLQGDLHNLIQLWFPIFSDKHKEEILDIILSLKNQGNLDRWESEGEIYKFSSYGLTTYLFLQALPLEYICSKPEVKLLYHQLQRKFPKITSKEQYSYRSCTRGISSPLKGIAYEKMNKAQWVKSFIKYDEDKIIRDFVGGMEQHGRRFEDEIKKRPKDFVDLVYDIIPDKTIHSDYIIYALSAFCESDLSIDLVEDIYVNAITFERYDSDKLDYIIRGIRKLFRSGSDNNVLINFIVNIALSYADPEIKDKDLYNISINSTKGIAVEALYYLDMQNHGELVFETIEAVANSTNKTILSSIIMNIAHLNRYDTERAFQLFLSITEKASDDLFIYSFNSAQYYVHHDFQRLNKYIERAKTIKDKNFKENISAILYSAWLYDYTNAESLLFDFVSEDPACISEIISCAIHNFYFENDKEGKKAQTILNKYLYKNDSDISHQYDCCFLHYKEANVKFIDFYPFVLKYVNSNAFNSKKYYVLDYLLENSSKYPQECFKIFQNMKFDKLRKEPESEYSSILKEKQMQLLMGFYNVFNNAGKSNRRRMKYINNLFDRLFEDISYKNNVDKVLDLISK